MMSESTDDMAQVVEEHQKEGEPGDNGALRQSGFVLVSGSGSEVSSLRQSSPVVTTANTQAMGTPPIGTPPSLSSSSREGSSSPRSNPYRGNLAQRHGHGHSHGPGHGHSHGAGHGHSHDEGEHSHEPSTFFTPSAPTPDTPLPSLSPPAPLPPVASMEPQGLPPLQQYQIPQFARPEPPVVAPIMRDVGQETFVGVGIGDDSGGSVAATTESRGPGGGGFFSNIFTSDLMHRVVEKTKSGMESVITTLDPGMKEYIMGGGDVNLVIATVDNVESIAIRDAFYTVVGKSSIRCLAGHTTLAPQLIGADAARQACEQKIDGIRTSGQVAEDAAIVAVANFLFQPTMNRWFVMEYLLLQDQQTECEAYSIPLPISSGLVDAIMAETPSDFPMRWSGTLKTLDQHIQQQQPVNYDPNVVTEWRYTKFGLTRRDLIAQTARVLARDYKQQFQVTGDVPSVPFAS